MGILRICDVCKKRIVNHEYVSAGFTLSNFTFHPSCVPSLARFLKKFEKTKSVKSKK